MSVVKKRNPDAEQGDGSAKEAPPTPPQLPPMRTFIIRSHNYTTGEGVERVVDAHGLAVDEARMLSFIVFFLLDGKPVQSTKLFLNSDAWTDVEEINENFPVRVTN